LLVFLVVVVKIFNMVWAPIYNWLGSSKLSTVNNMHPKAFSQYLGVNNRFRFGFVFTAFEAGAGPGFGVHQLQGRHKAKTVFSHGGTLESRRVNRYKIKAFFRKVPQGGTVRFHQIPIAAFVAVHPAGPELVFNILHGFGLL
jgi:hypothetical protein